MRELVIDYGVPLSLFLLMTIVGTELTFGDLKRVAQHPRAVLLAVMAQLFALPPLVLLVATVVQPGAFLTISLLLLALCPGGAISNSYCYLAHCNVSLAAAITTVGTLCSLISIPLWLAIVAHWTPLSGAIVTVPTLQILAQLLLLIMLPLAIGAAARRRWPDMIVQISPRLRWASLAIVLAILLAATWSARDDLYVLAGRIAVSATLFILGAMLLGRLLAHGLSAKDAPVLVIESAVRNVGIAAILGRILFTDTDFGTFSGFLTGYFMIEVVIMVSYAQFLKSRQLANS
jgi:BASS family bile acid:Na+ symporter